MPALGRDWNLTVTRCLPRVKGSGSLYSKSKSPAGAASRTRPSMPRTQVEYDCRSLSRSVWHKE